MCYKYIVYVSLWFLTPFCKCDTRNVAAAVFLFFLVYRNGFTYTVYILKVNYTPTIFKKHFSFSIVLSFLPLVVLSLLIFLSVVRIMSVIMSAQLKELLSVYSPLCDQCPEFCYCRAKYFAELFIKVWLFFKCCFKLWYLMLGTLLSPSNLDNFKHIEVVDSALLDRMPFKNFSKQIS